MAINQEKKEVVSQIQYMGRWVDKAHFRAFVYNESEQKLANSYSEYEKMISSGIWFNTQADAINAIKPKPSKKKSNKDEESPHDVGK